MPDTMDVTCKRCHRVFFGDARLTAREEYANHLAECAPEHFTKPSVTPKRPTIRPGPGKIAVEPLAASERTESGLYIPSTVTDAKPVVGTVVATCGAYTDERNIEREPNYQVGDRVIFGKYSGTTIQIDRTEYVILREQDILATLEDPANEGEEGASA